mgnify:CR=1 FL=1|jgi:hypothetical protein|tara:strand:+ start:652 stop:1020 length:369 start_codon:yes stop_codon:yes gene_type:complete
MLPEPDNNVLPHVSRFPPSRKQFPHLDLFQAFWGNFRPPTLINKLPLHEFSIKRQGRGGGGGGNRDAMMARMAKLEKLRTDADKKIKAILDKKQFKKYKAVMEEVVPPQRRPGGRGGPGGGG